MTSQTVANQDVRSVVGQLQSRQFGSGSGTWSLIGIQDRLVLFRGRQGVQTGCSVPKRGRGGRGAMRARLSRSILGSPEISKLTVTGRRVCVCKEKADEGRFIRN